MSEVSGDFTPWLLDKEQWPESPPSEETPFDTLWLYRASIDDGAPEWLLVQAAREIDRLRAEVADLRSTVNDLTYNMPHHSEAPRW